jgi:hypothetical protein
MTYPADHFRIVSELTKECFDYHPAWSEYYDFDERDEIESWGVDRAWLDEQLRTIPDHPHYTILATDPLPDRMRYFIKARFATPRGRELEGWVMNEDAFVAGVFVNGKEFQFRADPVLVDWMRKDYRDLLAAVGDSSDPIFPFRYSTGFRDSAGRVIEGEFTLPEELMNE